MSQPGGSCSESGSCAPRTPKQEELHKKLTQLRQEKEELDIKLHGESCQADPVETQLEAEKTRLAQVNNKIDYLKGTKANIEAKIAALKERSAERTKAIDTLSQYVDTEKTKLQGEMDKATKELQVEAQGRISIQEQLVSAYEQQQGGACPFNPQADAPAAMAAQSPNAGQAYVYPYDATVDRPARYLNQHLRQNPVRAIPFPNDAMDEAEAYGPGNC